MHFWIDKRSVCGQRRAPLTRNSRLYGPKTHYCPMVTPVHRFQRMESVLVDSGSVGGGDECGRVGRVGGRGRRSTSRPPTDDEEESVRVHLAYPTPTTTPAEDGVCFTRLSVPANHSSRRTSANSSVYSRMPNNFNLFRMGGINWCVWAVFIVVTILLVPAHLYLKNFNYRGELIGIFFVIILLFLVCFSVSLFHTKTRAILLHRLNLEDDARGCTQDSEGASPARRRPLFPTTTLAHNRLSRHLPYPAVRMSVSTPDLLVNGQAANEREQPVVARSLYAVLRSYDGPEHVQRSEVSPASDPESDPPPYHLAILLPTPTHSPTHTNCETPPPAYEIVQ